jgi:ribonuclease-3
MSDDPLVQKRFDKLSGPERVRELEARLGQSLTDPVLAVTALTHKSYCNEHRDEPSGDNERLEFLGDAVVDLVIGQRLMERFPAAKEGELSKLRSLIVNEDGLVRIARHLRLGELLLLGRGEELSGGRNKPSLLADALEAVVGAVYLSNGMGGVLQLVDAVFAESLEGVASGRQGQDSKSILQEEAQLRFKASPRYRVVSESGPEHEKCFEVEVQIGGDSFGRSAGRSKKEAEQAAARETLIQLQAPASSQSGQSPSLLNSVGVSEPRG